MKSTAYIPASIGLAQRLRGAAPAVGRDLNGALVGSDVNSYAQSGETKTEYRVCVCMCVCVAAWI